MSTSSLASSAPADLRIACLLPSATDICIALGLSASIVGVTHECNLGRLAVSPKQQVHILTRDGVDAEKSTQMEIHKMVQASVAANNGGASDGGGTADNDVCTLRPNNHNNENIATPPSLYPIAKDELDAARPTLIITQELCGVCAPTPRDVMEALQENGSSTPDGTPTIVTLAPSNLQDVMDTFVTVAKACGIEERGRELRKTFLKNLQQLKHAVDSNRVKKKNDENNQSLPRALLLEWIDPPFDGGHWIPDMFQWASVSNALSEQPKNTTKSVTITWDMIAQADPDLVLVSCCGFDLTRNERDALLARDRFVSNVKRAVQAGRVFASDGDSYFARPGPQLLTGVATMALAAYNDQPDVIKAIRNLPFVPQASDSYYQSRIFKSIDLLNSVTDRQTHSGNDGVPDIEDFSEAHLRACAAGKFTYKDPVTGYSVFTELGHKNRGRCCGSGCRHCPYNHENVKPEHKAARIQQPALLYTGDDHHDVFSSLKSANEIRVLFFSGGKDSFLTIRALVRSIQDSAGEETKPFSLVLMTTFDSVTRVIANQEIAIDTVLKQAQHLGIPLCAIPMHRGSSEGYVNRIRKALGVIENYAGGGTKISSLVFGDLHLDHIRDWRQDQLGQLGYTMEYPIWKKDYSVLACDLDSSCVPCIVSNSLTERVTIGTEYNGALRDRLRRDDEQNIDLFGENGEFHTCARVWETERHIALGSAKK